MSHVSYLKRLTPARFNDTVESMAALIRDKFPTCNMIFGRGLSSTMLLPALAAKLNVEWAVVRKGERTHSSYKVEASKWREHTRTVFVDDLIDTGASYRSALAEAKKTFKKHYSYNRASGISFECLGAACYASYCSDIKGVAVHYLD